MPFGADMNNSSVIEKENSLSPSGAIAACQTLAEKLFPDPEPLPVRNMYSRDKYLSLGKLSIINSLSLRALLTIERIIG